MDGLRSFMEADNHSAVVMGGLRRGTTEVQAKKPQFSEAFPEAVIREGADELTLRARWARSGPSSTRSTLRMCGGNRRLLMGLARFSNHLQSN